MKWTKDLVERLRSSWERFDEARKDFFERLGTLECTNRD